ncbi:MAG: hypothetical protein J6B87_07905 [Clostridia bacterium]|nr:hypothetical protein [Clostridia bacterium]
MKRQIVNSLLWTVVFFVVLAAIKYFTGTEDWLMQTILWTVLSGMGYFFGYGQARRDN